MIELLRKWLAPILAAYLVFLGVERFQKQKLLKPSGPDKNIGHEQRAQLLQRSHLAEAKGLHSDVDTSFNAASSDKDSLLGVALLGNPFRLPKAQVVKRNIVKAIVLPPRPQRLMGIVGQEVATVIDHMGQSVLVRIGEKVDSSTLVSIKNDWVQFRDKGGLYKLEIGSGL